MKLLAPPSDVDANCAAVRTAGAAPIDAGDPGYSSDLDRDGDGVACESYLNGNCEGEGIRAASPSMCPFLLCLPS